MSHTLPLPLQNTWELVERSQKDNHHGGKLRSPWDVDENLHKHLFLPGNPVLWTTCPGMKIVTVIANSKLSINVFFILHTYILALFVLFSKIMGCWHIFTVATTHRGTKMTLDELYINCIYCIYSMKNHSIHVKMKKMETLYLIIKLKMCYSCPKTLYMIVAFPDHFFYLSQCQNTSGLGPQTSGISYWNWVAAYFKNISK